MTNVPFVVTLNERRTLWAETQKIHPPKRLEILLLLADGFSYNEIAGKTGLTRGTIRNHVRLIYQDLDVANAEQAMRKWKLQRQTLEVFMG